MVALSTITDRFGVGSNFDDLVYVPGNLSYGPKHFYYLRHDAAGLSTFGTISTGGAVTDRFGVGSSFDALAFAPGNLGYGPKHFYYLRRDAISLSVTAPNGAPHMYWHSRVTTCCSSSTTTACLP